MGSGAVGCLGSFNCRIDHQPESGRTPPGEWRTASPTRWRVEPPRQGGGGEREGEGGGTDEGDGECLLSIRYLHSLQSSLPHRSHLPSLQLHRLQLRHPLHSYGGEGEGGGGEGGEPGGEPPRGGGESEPDVGEGGGGESGEKSAGDLRAGGRTA